jgi:PAS domain S-box-containing protein
MSVNQEPRKVRVWHFIVLPALAMGAAVMLARLSERLLPPGLDPVSHDVFHAVRTIVISLLMASLITWLAVSYRRQFEMRLRARNQALEQTQEFLTKIIEGSAEAIVTLDPQLRVTSWNRAAEEIYGWSAQQMIGESLERVLPEGAAAEAEKMRVHGQVRQGHTLRDYEASHRRRNGESVRVRMTVSPLHGSDGRFEGSTAIIRDVSSLITLERRLRQQDRLAAVGRLAAQVAHEIKNPLAGIRGACEVMMPGMISKPEREIAEEVVRQIDRLNRTVDELLRFSRPAKTRPAPTDLNDLIDRVLGVLLGEPRTRKLCVVRDLSPDLPSLTVDPEQMQQVLFNVLLNATQAMDYEGTLSVGTRVENASVVVSVRDSGPGLPAEEAETIFEPFYTTRAQGTGLGLAIVKKIVEAHGGTIQAGSPPEGGAEFRISLPRR